MAVKGIERFAFTGVINWFPGHMAKAARKMHETLGKVDSIIECRDARLPASTTNPTLHESIKGKRRVVVLTKADLCNRNVTNIHRERIAKEPNVVAVVLLNAKDPSPKAFAELKTAVQTESKFKQVWMVVGMPNTGKSTIINSLIAGGTKAPVSSTPGWTRGQTLYQLRKMNALLMDTPGVMASGVVDPIQGLKIAACGLIKDEVVPGGSDMIADYIVYYLNLRDKSREAYRSYYGVEKEVAVEAFAQLLPYVMAKFGKNDEDSAAKHLIRHFREGTFGFFTLDDAKEDKLHLDTRLGTRAEEI